MKMIWKYGFVLLAGLALTLSCSKENDPAESGENNNPTEQPGEQPQAKMVTITVSMPEEGLTKIAFEQDPENKDGAVKLTWEERDKILVNGEEFTLVSGAGTQTAGFSGPEVTADSYTIAYNGGAFGATQHQDADADTDHLAYIVSLADVNTYQDVEFTQAWATANGGGTLTQSSIFRLRAQMPAGVAEDVVAVKILARDADDAPVNIFGGGNELTVMIDNAGDAGDDGILDIYANLPTTAAAIPAGTAFFVRFMTTARKPVYSYTRYHVFSSALELTPGKVNALKLNCTATDKHAGLKSYCDGTTAAKAYLIGDAYQMDAARTLLVSNQVVNFKLIDDLDMSGIVWESLQSTANNDSWDKFISFDGNNKTISNLKTSDSVIKGYPSLFGVLQGSVKDLTIDNAIIYPGDKQSGVLAGYIGTGTNYTGTKEITNVHVKNSQVTGGTYHCGGFAATLNLAGYSITNCSVEDTEVSTTRYAAGFVANFAKSATISDITVSGTDVKSTGHTHANAQDGNAGGIAARVAAVVDFDRCSYSDGTVTGPENDNTDNSKLHRYVGGLVGYVGAVAATFDDCHTKNVTLSLAKAGSNNNNRFMGGAFGCISASVKVGASIGCSVTNVSGDETNNYLRNYVGGFIGRNNGGTIKNSSSSGSIVARGACAGFVGLSDNNSIFEDNSSSVTINCVGNVGGFAGQVESGSTFTRCHATGSVSASGSNSGGFVGNAVEGTYVNCDASGDVTSTAADVGGFVGTATEGSYTSCSASGNVNVSAQYVGGFAGQTNGICSFNGCYYTGGEVKCTYEASNNFLGGFCGYVRTTGAEFDGCYVDGATVTGAQQRVGGFFGQNGHAIGTDATTENCYVKDTNVQGNGASVGGFTGVLYSAISSSYVSGGVVKATGTPTGGFAGHGDNDLTACYSTTTVELANNGYSGGLIGRLYTASTISKCYYSGTITGAGDRCGGIVGQVEAVAAKIINCFSTGSYNGGNQKQIHGGIVGELLAGATVENCYSTMTISAGRVLGGIVGRAAGGGWNYETTTNNKISRCIAFNPSVTALQVGTYGSSGAIVGVTSIKNVLEKSYRLYNMNFANSNNWGNNMVDQEDCDGTNWTRAVATGTGDGNQCAYFGKAAAATATVSSLAQTLGWSSDVWDFTGDLPTLK